MALSNSEQALAVLKWRRANPDAWAEWLRVYRADLFARILGPVA